MGLRHTLFISIVSLLILGHCKAKGHHQHHQMGAGHASSDSIFLLTSQWQNAANQKVQLKSLGVKPTVLAMVYLRCKFVCPRITADMKYIQKKLPADKKSEVAFVIVTIDPENDSTAAFATYKQKQKLDNNFKFLRSNEADTRELAAVLGVRYKKLPDGEYSHSNMLHLLNEKGEIVYQQKGISAKLSETVEALKKLI